MQIVTLESKFRLGIIQWVYFSAFILCGCFGGDYWHGTSLGDICILNGTLCVRSKNDEMLSFFVINHDHQTVSKECDKKVMNNCIESKYYNSDGDYYLQYTLEGIQSGTETNYSVSFYLNKKEMFILVDNERKGFPDQKLTWSDDSRDAIRSGGPK